MLNNVEILSCGLIIGFYLPTQMLKLRTNKQFLILKVLKNRFYVNGHPIGFTLWACHATVSFCKSFFPLNFWFSIIFFQEVCVIRYEASSDDEKLSYVSLYSYFYSRKRCGVVNNCYTGVKDMYLVPLASHQPIPPELLPFDGPGKNVIFG